MMQLWGNFETHWSARSTKYVTIRHFGAVLVVAVAVIAGAGGCGSDSYDEPGFGGGTLTFLGFNSEGMTQNDAVNATSANVRICNKICNCNESCASYPQWEVCLGSCGSTTQLDRLPLTQTMINAVFQNIGQADIRLDRYWVAIDPAAGIPQIEYPLTALVQGGACGGDVTRSCSVNDDCGGETCVHPEVTVPVLLYDFDTKDHLVRGTCPYLQKDEANDRWVILGDPGPPQTYSVTITFSGLDEANHRFTVPVLYQSTFADFACP